MTGFDFDPIVLASAFVFGVIGMWMLSQGRKKANYEIIFISLALMVYPYFINGRIMNWAIGLGLCGLAYHRWNHP